MQQVLEKVQDRILVVDDDEFVRKGLAMNLEREGFEVETASSGEEALERLAQRGVDLMLCDIVLGGMDGIEVLRRLQLKWPDIAAVMITGHGSVNSALDALRNGASDYIQKPAMPEEVVHRIRSVLDATRLRRALQQERHKTEQRKAEMHEQLIRAERMVSLGTLADGAAHDLSHILSPILKHAGQLRAALPSDSLSQKLIDEIESAGRKAAAVIQDLQTIGSGGQFEKKHVNLNTVVEHWLASDSFAELQDKHPRVRLQLHLGADMPRIAGSSLQLANVVGNLVINAFEAMPSGGVVEITTLADTVEHPVGRYGAGQPGDYAVLKVRDTGAGMHPEDVERIFEPFYIRKKMGRHILSGLGLTLVYRVVADHGGFIDVETAPGKGTAFMIYLPLPEITAVETLDLRGDYSGGETVLVVDDYEVQRTAAVEILKDLGYNVVTASSGREAVELFQAALDDANQQSIDLAVIDLVLGDEFDGVETFKAMVELCPDQKAIMVSGFADINRIVEARKLGISRCLQKPYSKDTLGKAVRQELDS